jgi:flagellar biogenesis protein FliO
VSGEKPPEDDDDARFTISLAGLAVAILLVIVGYWLVDRLASQSKLEDCMMAGRQNCVPIDGSALGN